MTYRMIERAQRGLFAQLVIVPLFTQRHILTQVAGHEMAVIRILPPLVVTDEDVEEFAGALRATIKDAQRMPRSLTKFALSAATAGVRSR
jgi:ornithine--oxo-acid transaminase